MLCKSDIKILCFSHTKELLDEALDSVKSVLMQTFKKNLDAGGDFKYIIIDIKSFLKCLY
jgi:hypothetical protein